jgi:hypothetical protein
MTAKTVPIKHCFTALNISHLLAGYARRPSHPGLFLTLPGHSCRRGNINQVAAARAFDLSAREPYVASHVLFAVGAFKFEFVHSIGFGVDLKD